ncbi:MAG: HNH nuclease family protein [Magnetococcales bacterium]|nr:HNH nuclease family protein [Magnetococcales bacterium]
MVIRRPRPAAPLVGKNRLDRIESIVGEARKRVDERMSGYREQSLRLHPHVCARCGRVFSMDNLQELTVHHKDHNHENNPPDGSNWENLCVYCHDNEHARYVDHDAAVASGIRSEPKSREPAATHQPFAKLKDMFGKGGGS